MLSPLLGKRLQSYFEEKFQIFTRRTSPNSIDMPTSVSGHDCQIWSTPFFFFFLKIYTVDISSFQESIANSDQALRYICLTSKFAKSLITAQDTIYNISRIVQPSWNISHLDSHSLVAIELFVLVVWSLLGTFVQIKLFPSVGQCDQCVCGLKMASNQQANLAERYLKKNCCFPAWRHTEQAII